LLFIPPLANPRKTTPSVGKTEKNPGEDDKPNSPATTRRSVETLRIRLAWRREKDEEEDQRNENVITTRIL
jgi:hypothetical protein